VWSSWTILLFLPRMRAPSPSAQLSRTNFIPSCIGHGQIVPPFVFAIASFSRTSVWSDSAWLAFLAQPVKSKCQVTHLNIKFCCALPISLAVHLNDLAHSITETSRLFWFLHMTLDKLLDTIHALWLETRKVLVYKALHRMHQLDFTAWLRPWICKDENGSCLNVKTKLLFQVVGSCKNDLFARTDGRND